MGTGIEDEGAGRVILEMYEAMREADYERLADLHSSDGYTRYSDLPPYGLMDIEESLRAKASLMTQIQDFGYEITNLAVRELGGVAIATYEVSYGGILVYDYRFEGRSFRVRSRCTAILIKEAGRWRILHEHHSRIPEEER